MKHKAVTALALLSLSAAAARAETTSPAGDATHQAKAGQTTAGQILGEQIADIAGSTDISVQEKTRRLKSALQVAVGASIANLKNADDALSRVLDLATNAGKAAPDFAEIIAASLVDAAQKSPVLLVFDGLKEAIENAVYSEIPETAQASRQRREKGRKESHEFGGAKDDVIVSPDSSK